MDRKIINRAIENLNKNTGIHAVWEKYVHHGLNKIDGKIRLKLKEQNVATCFVAAKKEIRKHHIPKLKALAEEYKPFLLIVNRLYPNLKKNLHETNIDWLDGDGNIHFKNNNFLIWIDHHKTTPPKEKKNRAFTKTGLKVIFLFLHDEKWINKTYREIAGAADVALGNIKHILDGLKQKNFLIKEAKKKYKLINKPELLDQWVTAFTDELKPRIHIGNFKFMNETNQRKWKNLTLKKETFWGGEPGAELLTANLKPADWILYTHHIRSELMKDYRLKPDPEGNIEVYNPYWTIDTPKDTMAPPLVIYTDLMATGDPRNINIAEEIYGKFLTHLV